MCQNIRVIHHLYFGMFDLPLVISLLSTLISLIMLALTRQDMNRRERKDQEMFVNEVYKNFQELHVAILDDPSILNILAQEQDQDEGTMRINYIASLLINNAYKNYRLYQNGLIPQELWKAFCEDMKDLFSWNFIYDRWSNMQVFFPKKFQDFINNQIVVKNSKPNKHLSNGTKSNSLHL